MTNDLCVKVAIVTQSLVNYLSNILHSNPPFAQTPSPARNEYLYSKNGCGNTQKNHSKNSKESLSEDKEAQVSLLMNESGFKKWFGF